MAKMKNNTVLFAEKLNSKLWNNDTGKLVTPNVTLTWAQVTEPDSEYLTYSVEFALPKSEAWVKQFVKDMTAWENEMRASQDQDEVEIASIFLTDKGDPRVSEDGENWLVRASGKTNDESYTTKSGKVIPPFQKNKPRVYNLQGKQDPDVEIWSGDICRVACALGFYRASGSFGTKLYLKDIQQIEAGPGPRSSNPFGDESDGVDDGDSGEDLPF